MKIIVKMVFGSHLYGTDTPDSDKDYKGVYMPTTEQIYLGKIPKSYSEKTGDDNSKNTKDDVDTEIYSLHYFLKLACEGQTVALDMLHAPKSKLIITSDLWEKILRDREKFYTKNMQAFLGYASRQAAKYGIKGSRLAAAKSVIDYIWKKEDENIAIEYCRLKDVWEELPMGEHIHNNGIDPNGNRIYQVCSKKIQDTATLQYLFGVIEKFYKAYGERARQAERNEGIDFKAVSHAIRAAYQLIQLYKEETITFPLKQAKFIREVKAGNLDYKTKVAPLLEDLIEEVKDLAENSDYPEKVNRKYWDKFLIDEVDRYINYI